jgi:hypothetical protein
MSSMKAIQHQLLFLEDDFFFLLLLEFLFVEPYWWLDGQQLPFCCWWLFGKLR